MTYRETRVGDWWAARQRRERLPEHNTCELCGEPSEARVCSLCTETQLEALNYERTREAH